MSYDRGEDASRLVDGSQPGGLMSGQSPRQPNLMYKLFFPSEQNKITVKNIWQACVDFWFMPQDGFILYPQQTQSSFVDN